jgi:hypothetical protein
VGCGGQGKGSLEQFHSQAPQLDEKIFGNLMSSKEMLNMTD